MTPASTKEAVMADDPEDPTPDPKPDPDAGAKKALDAERKARRDAEQALKDLRAEVETLKGKDKGDVERLTEKLTAAEKRAADAEAKTLRLEVAAEKGVKARWLSGDTREDLEAAADEYLADHPPAEGKGPAPGKPVEDLRGGGEPTEGPEPDIRKIVESIPRGI